MKKKLKETIINDLKNELGSQMGSSGALGVEGGALDYLNLMSELPESEDIIRKPKKKSNITSLVGKTKMKLPIGKLYSIGKTESKELDEKWSEKYKKSIDCNNPKGFSQRAHCQGRKKKQMSEEVLKGGKADKKTLMDLIKKHDPKGYYHPKNSLETLKKQLDKGIKVEMEHTKNKQKAKEIAMDHLYEDPKYYNKLKKIEGKEATGAGSAGGFLGKVAFNPNSDFVKKSFEETPKKVETKEATGASSAGQYSTTAAWAKSTSKKDWRGKSKTQIPGGKFVQVKKKCKKFPYCNQGDIKALKIFDHVEVKKVIKEVSESYGVSENVIKNIIAYEYNLYKSNK